MNQQKKAELTPAIKAVLQKYGVKGSISVSNHSTLIVTLKEGKIAFGPDDEGSVNTYYIKETYKNKPTELNFLTELHNAMSDGNFDHSDVQTDYFCVGWYVDIRIGTWDKPYLVKE
jgi:hypothetical protein